MMLSKQGHEVIAVDNYLRRHITTNTDSEALYPTPNLHRRAALWKEYSGRIITVRIGDLCHWDFVSGIFSEFRPDAVIHYAEQPSAPYSMMDCHAGALTITNNLMTTYNILQCVGTFCPECHIVKLGTMGEYGTPDIDIEEGWIDIEHKGRKQKFLYPRQASSLYHTTKIMDTDLIWFYVRMWNLRCTDLMQGPVYGIETDENVEQEELYPFFNYDELFGTVVNRFVAQAVAGYPLTVYGKGGQTRGYLNIRDTLQCVDLSLKNPPPQGQLEIYNQFVETFSVNELAKRVSSCAQKFGLQVRVKELPNPRIEAEEHYYNPAHSKLLELGLKPHYLDDEALGSIFSIVLRHKHSINTDAIFRNVTWK
jgi:UDP-sulfoquinovose synthase